MFHVVSIHALLAECDLPHVALCHAVSGFNPRTPCGVRPAPLIPAGCINLFQSTHSLRSATVSSVHRTVLINVSIHALLAECDFNGFNGFNGQSGFNPRTPCGVRPYQFTGFTPTNKFQSTHSLRSATQPTLYITTQQSKSYFAPTSLKRPSLHGYTF